MGTEQEQEIVKPCRVCGGLGRLERGRKRETCPKCNGTGAEEGVQVDSAPDESGAATSDDRVVTSSATSAWICPKCNVVVSSLAVTTTGKKKCLEGHELSEVMNFWRTTIGLTIAWPVYRLAFLVAGIVWAPLEQFWAYGLLAMLFLIVWMPIKGTAFLLRGGPVRRLAPACYGMALGSVLGGAVTGVMLWLMFGTISFR